MEGQDVGISAEGNGRQGYRQFGQAGVGTAAGESQARPGGINGSGIVKGNFAQPGGDGGGLKIPHKDFLKVGVVFGLIIEVVGGEREAQGFGQVVDVMGPARIGNQQYPAAAGGEIGYGGGGGRAVSIDGQDDQQGGGGAQLLLQLIGILQIGDFVAAAGHPGRQGGQFLRVKGVAVGKIHQQQTPVGGDGGVKNRGVGKGRRFHRIGNGVGKGNIRGLRRGVAAAGVKGQVRRQKKGGDAGRKEQQQQGFTERRRHTGNKTPAD